MGIVGGVAIAGAAASMASSVKGMTDGGGGSGGGATGSYGGQPGTYIPQSQPQADQMFMNNMNMANAYGSVVPGQTIPNYDRLLDLPGAYQNLLGQYQNNPYSGGYLQAANSAAGMMPGQAGQANQAGYGLYGSGQSALPYGQQILQTGFDPQRQLYDRSANNLMQQLSAMNASTGVSGPAAAGTNAQALGNFNIDWQNQQLGRQTQAASGYGNLINGVNSAFTGGSNNFGVADNMMLQSGALPYQAYTGFLNDQYGALQNFQQGVSGSMNAYTQGVGNAMAPLYQQNQQLMPYMQLGQSASGQAMQGQGQNFGQQQQIGAGAGRSLAQLNDLGRQQGWWGGATDSGQAYNAGATYTGAVGSI